MNPKASDPARPAGPGEGLCLLKLGGALLTEKDGVEAPRLALIDRLVDELRSWEGSASRLILCHGSGSFAHVAVQESGFLEDPGRPMAIAEVAAAAARLNRLVVERLIGVGLPAVSVPGSLLAVCEDGEVQELRAGIVADLLAAGLLPTFYGDAAPDRKRGGAIASTEPLMLALARAFDLRRVIVATDVDGVFRGDPNAEAGAQPIPRITPADRADLDRHLGSARAGAVDVTGGMRSKVERMLDLVEACPETEVRILSGLREGALLAALRGRADAGGTRIVAAAPAG